MVAGLPLSHRNDRGLRRIKEIECLIVGELI